MILSQIINQLLTKVEFELIIGYNNKRKINTNILEKIKAH